MSFLSVRISHRILWSALFLLPALVLFALFFIYPLLFIAFSSLTEWNGVSSPQFVGISNYIDAFSSDNFQLATRNNIIWALALGFGQIAFALVVAMILARKPRGWGVLRTIYFLPSVISKIAIATMWTALYNAEFGAINKLLQFLGLDHWTRNWLGEIETALPSVIFQEVIYIGYFMVIILAGISTIPKSYYEAAQIDGANALQQEWHITLPLLRGVLLTASTLALAFGLRHFESTFLMTRGGPANQTVVLGILLYRDMGALNYGNANAIGMALVVIGGISIAVLRWIFGRRDQQSESSQ